MKKQTLFVLLGMAIVLYSCRKEMEKPSWDTEILAPIAKASLSINNLLPDSILQSNADSTMKIVFEDDIYKISMDTLFNIQDTTLHNSYNIPITWGFRPGDNFIPNNTSETTYDL